MAAETKDRLTKTATRLFADKGFHETSVKEVCSEAEANIAAVNYHFGGKEQLYASVLRKLCSESSPAPTPKEGDSAEDFLRGFAMSLIEALESGKDPLLRILAREQLAPTGVAREAIGEMIRSRHESLALFLVSKTGASRERADLATLSMVGALVHFSNAKMFTNLAVPILYEKDGSALSKKGVQAAVNFVARATMAALRMEEEL